MRLLPETEINPAIIGNYRRPTFFIGIPTFGTVSIEWALAFGKMQLPLNSVCTSMVAKGLEVGNARQFLAEKFLESNARYLLFFGDDNIPHWNSLTYLFDEMEKNPDWDMLAGLYHLKQEGPPVIVGWGQKDGPLMPGRDFTPGDIVEVENAGLDFILIRRETMLKIAETPAPWFKTCIGYDERENLIARWTEDTFFYQRCKKTGLKLRMHTRCLIGHFDWEKGKMF